MSDLRRSRYSRSSRSLSRSPSRSRSRSHDYSEADNPGNNLYVTGLSSRVTEYELERHFEREGKVTDVHLMTDPWTRESRGFGFVTMATVKDALHCIKYLDGSILEGRVITVEKARRARGRTPTPGKYLGVRTVPERRQSPSYSLDDDGSRYSSGRERSYSPYFEGRRYRSPSRSPYYSRPRSPYYRRYESSYYRGYGLSPISRRRRLSYSRNSRSYSRSVSPYYRRQHRQSISRSTSPRLRKGRRSTYTRSIFLGPRSSRRDYSPSISPPKRSSRRDYSRSYSPRPRGAYEKGHSRRTYSRESYSHSRNSTSSRSRSASRSRYLSPCD
uniref:Putative RNA-binding protein C25G10.01 n=1 Tax=Anthurium amnicola TaxID=1678845 RepID=A0A1D1Z5R7_9ARAE